MSIPIFGDVPASDVIPVAAFFGEYATPYTINNNTAGDTTFITMTMPFTGMLTVNAVVNHYYATPGRQQCINYITCAAIAPSLSPWAQMWSEGGAATGYHHATVPVVARWDSVNSGTNLVLRVHHAVGTGGPNCVIYNVCGSAHAYRL